MATRGYLHMNHLPGLKVFFEREGYEIQKTKGYYEVFRAKKPNKPPVIFFRRGSSESVTAQDNGDGWRMAVKFMRERKAGAGG